VAARACVALIAVVAVAWLGVLERDTRLLARGLAGLERDPGAGQLASAESDLRAARLLNPDTAPDFNRALVYQARGDAARAQATLEDVLRREPDNLRTWAALSLLVAGRDEAAARRAREARLRLDPLNARAAR